jgi:hypothetical protein
MRAIVGAMVGADMLRLPAKAGKFIAAVNCEQTMSSQLR